MANTPKMATGGKAFKGNKPQPGSTGPRYKNGGMVTAKQFEKSSVDKAMDSKKGAPKEGSKRDMTMDKKAMAKMNKGKR